VCEERKGVREERREVCVKKGVLKERKWICEERMEVCHH
jgi:hypothetical protein